MERFNRLREGDATELERALLESASDDDPSAMARQRTLVAMGLGAGVLAAAPSAAHAASNLVRASAAASGAAKGVGSASALMVLKWLGTGAVVGSVLAAGVATITTPGLVFSKRAVAVQSEPAAPLRDRSTQPAVVSAKSPGPASALIEPAPEPVKFSPEPRAAKGERPAVVPAQAEPALIPPPPAAAVPLDPRLASSTVVAEVASLDRARAALAAGDPRTALARLAEHDAAFPGGTLQPEAVVLRVRSLIQLGDSAQAASVANRFLAAHPDSAQAGRLRGLVSRVR